MLPASRSKYFLSLLIVCLLGAAACFIFLRPSGPDRTIRFQLRRGISAREIAQDLTDTGVLRHRGLFLLWVKAFGARRLRPGVYDLSSRSTGLSLYRQFIKGPPLVKVTFPEGWMSSQMAALLESKGICPAVEFQALVNKDKREGMLFPDTYYFEQETPATRVVERMVTQFQSVRPSDLAEREKALGLKPGQALIMASLIEREARAPSERALIAGVFYNRLRKRMHLESCATVEYALGAWKPRLLYKDLQVNSPYNTYRHAGLPPGPICNPGLPSLQAALHPEVTDHLYFVADGQGTHRFSRDYKAHLNARKKR